MEGRPKRNFAFTNKRTDASYERRQNRLATICRNLSEFVGRTGILSRSISFVISSTIQICFIYREILEEETIDRGSEARGIVISASGKCERRTMD